MSNFVLHVRRGLTVVAANLVNMFITLGRNKMLAQVLGPSGVGWIALATSFSEICGNLTGTGVCDGLSREISWSTEEIEHQRSTSAAVAIFIALFAVCFPFIGWFYLRKFSADNLSVIDFLWFAAMALGASSWRFFNGIFLGFGQSRRIFYAMNSASVVCLLFTAGLLWWGTRQAMIFAAIPFVLLGVTGAIAAMRDLKQLVVPALMWRSAAWRSLLLIAVPSSLGAVLEPAIALLARLSAERHFGQHGVGMIQPGLQFANLASTVVSGFLVITICRWDQSREPAFSRRSLLILAAAFALPLIGIAGLVVLDPIWRLVVRALYSRAFIPGAEVVGWFLVGESLRMGMQLLQQTFLARRQAVFSIAARLSGVATMLGLARWCSVNSIVDVGRDYAIAFATAFVVALVLWVISGIRFSRAIAGLSGSL